MHGVQQIGHPRPFHDDDKGGGLPINTGKEQDMPGIYLSWAIGSTRAELSIIMGR